MKNLLLQIIFSLVLATCAHGQGQWAWMKGDTAVNFYNGVPGMSDPSFDPSCRYASTGWSDNNDGLWMYSGNNFSDLWKYSISDNEWEFVKEYSTFGTAPVFGAQGVPDPSVYPGYVGFGTPHWVIDSSALWIMSAASGDVFRFDIAQQNWAWMGGPGTGSTNQPPVYGVQGVPADSVTPGEVQGGFEVNNEWVDSLGNLWLCHGKYGTVWKYSTDLNQWTWMHGIQAPPISVPPFYTALGEFDPTGLNTPGTETVYGPSYWLNWQDSEHHFWMMIRRWSTNRVQIWEFDPEINRWACHLDEENEYIPADECWETTWIRPKMTGGEQRSAWVDNCDNAYVFLFDTIISKSKLWRYNMNTTEFMLVNSYDNYHFGPQGVLDTTNHPILTTGSVAWTANNEFWYRGSNWGGNATIWKYVPDSVHANFSYTFDPITCETHFSNESSSGCNTIKSWQWDFGDGQTSTEENPSHFFSTSGNYQITLIVENCSWDLDTLTQNITVQHTCPVELSVQYDDSLCIGDCSTLTFESLGIIPLQSILINGVAQSSVDSTEICPDQTTEYIITAIGENGTIDEDTIVITLFELPTLFVSDDQTICPPDSVILEAESDNALTFLWSTGSTSSNTEVYSTGAYWVIAEDEHCNSSDTVSVTLLCTILLEMPNVFTPHNQDGINDMFSPVEHEAIEKYRLTIFNRWGNTVFETTDINEGWDGTFKGENCQAGTYFWVVEYEGADEQAKVIHGNLTLIP